jgi:deoxyribonuclease V
MMIACLDVDYRDSYAIAGCVLFAHWDDATSVREHVVRVSPVHPYEPGNFYRRELPCLVAVLREVTEPLQAIIVDGYVWLDEKGTPGLGARLHEAYGGVVPVIGVAKTRFHGADVARPVLRGESSHPLYVTAAGIDVGEAAARVQGMHGSHRVPTLLKRVDRLCRSWQAASA